MAELSQATDDTKPKSNLALRLLTASFWAPLILWLLYAGPFWGFPLLSAFSVAEAQIACESLKGFQAPDLTITSETRYVVDPDNPRAAYNIQNFFVTRGAAYNAEGKHELDASIMDGATLEPLKALVREWGESLPGVALRFVLAHPAVTTVIPGMRALQRWAVRCGDFSPQAAPVAAPTSSSSRPKPACRVAATQRSTSCAAMPLPRAFASLPR